MDGLFQPLATALGGSVDQIKLIFCLLISYPLGSLFIRIPSSKPALRHAFNIGIALLFFFPILQIYSAFLQLLAGILTTYTIAKYDKSSRMPWVVFVIAMGHLFVNHVIRAIYNYSYETVEVTGPQMILTMKLTTFAWNVYDGRRKTEELDKWQLAKRVSQYPSLLEFLGYSFYFPGILVGPYLDFAEYMEVINETMFQHAHVKATLKAGRNIPPGRKRAAYTKLIMSLLFLGVFVLFGPTYNYTVALKPDFMKTSLLRRILLFQIVGPFERSKYYALWGLTEGASILTGLGFTGVVDGRPQWDGAANVKIRQIELPDNFKVLLDAWNMKTNIWLRECVYKRVTPKGKKPGNTTTMITFMTSAIWHGVSSGYYLTFLLAGFITSAARLVRQNIRPFFASGSSDSPAKRLYDAVGIITTIFILNYAASPFILLTAKGSIGSWRVLGFYGHIVVLGALAFFYLGGTRYLKGLQKQMGILPPSKAPAKSGMNGTETPIEEKNFVMMPAIDKIVEK